MPVISCSEVVNLSENLTVDPAAATLALAKGLEGVDMRFSYRKIYTTIQYFTQRWQAARFAWLPVSNFVFRSKNERCQMQGNQCHHPSNGNHPARGAVKLPGDAFPFGGIVFRTLQQEQRDRHKELGSDKDVI